MSKLEKILDECIDHLASGQATLDDCLTRYPEHAGELRRLINLTTYLEQGRNVHASSTFKARNRAKLIAHINAHPRRQPFTRWPGFLPIRFFLNRAFNTALAIAAVLTLFLTTGTVLAQTALPGDTLYEWKLASEELFRAIYPDPVAVDLMVAKRRIYEAQTVVDPQAKELALEGYEQSLSRLSTYTDSEDQALISKALQVQKIDLAEVDLVVPELEQLLETVEGEHDRSHEQNSIAQQAYLSLNSPSAAVASNRITYNLTVLNNGPADSATATLTGRLSPVETLVSADNAECQVANDHNVACTIENVPADTPYPITLTTSVDPCFSGPLNTTITVTGTNEIANVNPDNQLLIDSNITTSFPTSARVVYVQSDDQTHSLGMVSSSGNLITSDLHLRAAAPAWSPNGTKLAFFGVQGISELTGAYTQGNGVWTVDVVGNQARNPRQLMGQDHLKALDWSPDGTKLVVEIGIPNLPHEIVVLDAQDGQQLGRFIGEQPAWNPDSQTLIIKSCSPECGLWQVEIDGSLIKQMTFNSTDSYPAWSPDGQYLAFSSLDRAGNWEIYWLRLADGHIFQVTNRSATDTTPVFGPCGQDIYLRTDAYGGWWITAVKLDGSEEYQIKEGVGGSTRDWGLARPAVHY